MAAVQHKEDSRDTTPPPVQSTEPPGALVNGHEARPSSDGEKGVSHGSTRTLTSRNVLKLIKKKSGARRKMLAKQLGINDGSELGSVLSGRREQDEYQRLRYKINPSKYRQSRERYSRRRTAEDDEVAGITKAGEDEYKGSNVFLKGTQSANPHNDYSQHFIDTGQRAQNFIRDVGKGERFKEYPKLQELIRLKDQQIKARATQPMYLKCDPRTFDFGSLGSKFDVILLTPPLEEYQRRGSGATFSWSPVEWEDIMALKVEEMSAQRAFVFLWSGSGEGLDIARECFKKWGFRRCEDICWVKTNMNNPGNKTHLDQKAIFQNTKEHCLMGIKGTVRRNQDGHFIHANIDLDLIITEEPELETEYCVKPEEIYDIIEHFCLGRRRLHLYGNDSTIRPGWLTLGPDLSSTNFSKDIYLSFFEGPDGYLLGQSDEIEARRPKTPPMKNRGGRGGRGGGRGVGLPGVGRGGPPSGRGIIGRTF